MLLIFKNNMNNNIITYFLALLGLILFSSGLCVLGEAIISKYENSNWILIGTISLVLINSGLGLMIKNKWGTF